MKKILLILICLLSSKLFAQVPAGGWGPHYLACFPEEQSHEPYVLSNTTSFETLPTTNVSHVETIVNYDSNGLLTFKGTLTFWRYNCQNNPQYPAMLVTVKLLEKGPGFDGIYPLALGTYKYSRNYGGFTWVAAGNETYTCSNLSLCDDGIGFAFYDNPEYYAGKTYLFKIDDSNMRDNFDFKIFLSNYDERVFTVPAYDNNASPTTSISSVTGLWYDPALSGLGFNFAQAPNGLLTYYYGYNKNGEPLWLVSDLNSAAITKGSEITLNMYQAKAGNGANFNTRPTAGNSLSQWGTMTVEFTSCTTGTATLSGIDGTQVFALQKLANIAGLTCTE